MSEAPEDVSQSTQVATAAAELTADIIDKLKEKQTEWTKADKKKRTKIVKQLQSELAPCETGSLPESVISTRTVRLFAPMNAFICCSIESRKSKNGFITTAEPGNQKL